MGSKFKYSEEEKQINRILIHQDDMLKDIKLPDMEGVDSCIRESEELLRSLGYGKEVEKAKLHVHEHKKELMVVPTWEQLCNEADQAVNENRELESIFTTEELINNEKYIKCLKKEYDELHKMDAIDYSICALAGIIAGAVDILLVGIPAAGKEGTEAGPLSDYIRRKFNEAFPPEEMSRLADSKDSKVPYDAQDNRNTSEYVQGLSAYYHRLLSLGHDPILGFVVGVFDIMTGRMTTIDKSGKIVSQVMECYTDRKETNIFAAIAKQFAHLKSDITTSMGLPAPMMGLFNLLQFGSIGEENQTIAEIVQGMYYEGYDFIHFCSMSIPVMVVEVIVRILYALKRIKEGCPIKDSIPFSLNRERHPKLSTMLFIAHSAATAINAGKVYFTHNPVAINYPQWMAFAKYSYKQLKWSLMEKPELRMKYINGKINEELEEVYASIDDTFNEFSKDYIVVFN